MNREKAKEELQRIGSPEYLYQYIVNVINHGSHGLGFPGGEMEGGYVPPDVAPDIACYVMELGGHRCPRPYSRKAQMYFSSVCAGCHGLDGKGLHGSYPDLTRPTLLGIEKRREFLKILLSD
jgi:mono/diheme cytochrome c family protein